MTPRKKETSFCCVMNLPNQQSIPMAIVQSVEKNSLNEVTAAYLFKGSTRERVYRHVTSLILLLPADDSDSSSDSEGEGKEEDSSDEEQSAARNLVRRQAVVKADARVKSLIAHNLV